MLTLRGSKELLRSPTHLCHTFICFSMAGNWLLGQDVMPSREMPQLDEEATSCPEHAHKRLVHWKLKLQHRISRCSPSDRELHQKLCQKEREIMSGNDLSLAQREPRFHSPMLALSPAWVGCAPRSRPTRSLEGKLQCPLLQHSGTSATTCSGLPMCWPSRGLQLSSLHIQAPALGAQSWALQGFALHFSFQ